MVLPGLKWAMVINGNLAVQWKTTIKGLVHMPAIILTHTAKSENTEDSIEIVGFWVRVDPAYTRCVYVRFKLLSPHKEVIHAVRLLAAKARITRSKG